MTIDHDEQVDVFFDRLSEDDTLELSADDVGTRLVPVRSASRHRSSILVEIDEASRDLVAADVPLRARIADLENSPLVCASFDRADRDLARLHVRPPDARDRRESVRVSAPSDADASLVELDHEDEEDDPPMHEADVLDLGLGGIGVALAPGCGLHSDQEVEVELSVGADWSLTCTGRIVYFEPLEEDDRVRAGVEFLQLSEEWRQSLLRIMSQASDDEVSHS